MFTNSTGYAIGTGRSTERNWIYEVKSEGSDDEGVIICDMLTNNCNFEASRFDLVELTKYEYDTLYDMVADGVPGAHTALAEYLIERGGPFDRNGGSEAGA